MELNYEIISAIGIIFEVAGFVLLLPSIKRKLNQRFKLISVINTWKLKIGVWLQRNRSSIGIYCVIFGLFLQIISLLD